MLIRRESAEAQDVSKMLPGQWFYAHGILYQKHYNGLVYAINEAEYITKHHLDEFDLAYPVEIKEIVLIS